MEIRLGAVVANGSYLDTSDPEWWLITHLREVCGCVSSELASLPLYLQSVWSVLYLCLETSEWTGGTSICHISLIFITWWIANFLLCVVLKLFSTNGFIFAVVSEPYWSTSGWCARVKEVLRGIQEMAEQSKLFLTELGSIVEDFTCLLLLVSLSGTCKLNFQLTKYVHKDNIFFSSLVFCL